MKCNGCGKELVGKQTKWCSVSCKMKKINTKHQNYATQQKRGIDRKKEFIDLLGSKCVKCGYDKCQRALTFHHRDSSQKSFGLDIRSMSNRKYEVLLEEVNKCDLLCFNCHMELHHDE